jgi:hypothetical protein
MKCEVRILGQVLVVWLSIVGTLLAGEASRTSGEDASAALVESYRVGKDLVPSERAILLTFLCRTASQHNLSFTTDWAQEALHIASQLPPDWNRLAVQKKCARCAVIHEFRSCDDFAKVNGLAGRS